MLNSQLLKAANEVINSKYPGQFQLTVQFISAKLGSKFSFYPIFVDGMTITQDFAENYADEIDLQLTVSVKDYALMFDEGSDLLCVVTKTYTDRHGGQIFNPPPVHKQYRAVINDPRNMRATVPDVQAYTEATEPMSLRLIEESVYNARHTKINAIYQVSTITHVIQSLTQSFGIEKLHLVPPDNKHVYDHIEIGSYQDISSVFGYLQSTCGVYQKGINSYLTQGVLYVYPAFDTDPQYDKSAFFYQVDTGRFVGNPVFHKRDGGNISIVINTQPQSVDLSITGSENIGTGFIFNRASRLTDGYTTIDSNDGAKFTEKPSLSISLANPRTAVGGRNNIFHVKGTDNPFPHMSEIISHQATLMTLTWREADPFLLDPAHKLTYYFDRNEAMVKRTGMLERAVYHITRVQRMDTKSVFGCVAELTLRLAPEPLPS